jgi:hypothetical protein
MKSTVAALATAIVTLAVGFGVIAVAALWYGFATEILWSWFVVPLGAPSISIAQAVGLALVVGLFTHTQIIGDDKEKLQQWFNLATKPAIALLAGVTVRAFM